MSSPRFPGLDHRGRVLASVARAPQWAEQLELIRTCRTLIYADMQRGEREAALRIAGELRLAADKLHGAISRLIDEEGA